MILYVSQASLPFQNVLLNPNVVNRSRETRLFMRFSDQRVTQFSDCMPTKVSYLKPLQLTTRLLNCGFPGKNKCRHSNLMHMLSHCSSNTQNSASSLL